MPDADEPADARFRAPNDAIPRVLDRAAGDAAEDWTASDIHHSMRALWFGTEAQIRRELRKLHLRYGTPTDLRWSGCSRRLACRKKHCAWSRPSSTLAACRAWQHPAPDPTLSVELVLRQDIMFYKSFMVFHLVGRADRWHAARVIDNKRSDTLCEAVVQTWIQVLGPFHILVVDGERGLFTAEAADVFCTHSIQVRKHAPGQHACIFERRVALLQHALHCTEAQLVHEGLSDTFPPALGASSVRRQRDAIIQGRDGVQSAFLVHSMPCCRTCIPP